MLVRQRSLRRGLGEALAEDGARLDGGAGVSPADDRDAARAPPAAVGVGVVRLGGERRRRRAARRGRGEPREVAARVGRARGVATTAGIRATTRGGGCAGRARDDVRDEAAVRRGRVRGETLLRRGGAARERARALASGRGQAPGDRLRRARTARHAGAVLRTRAQKLTRAVVDHRRGRGASSARGARGGRGGRACGSGGERAPLTTDRIGSNQKSDRLERGAGADISRTRG